MIEPEFTFYFPNAFSPNEDNINDEFFGKGENISDYQMSIYNRWGNLIFYADEINKHWNGTMQNSGSEIVPLDVYVYVITLTERSGKHHKYIGSVTVVN